MLGIRNNGLILGLDIGITSVGYGIIRKETGEAVDYGVRLFNESVAAANQKRRERRSGRRSKSRRANRLSDFKKLLIEFDLISYNYHFSLNPYRLRKKGLTEKLDKEELATALYNLVKLRGSSLETVEDDEKEQKSDSELSTKTALSVNDHLLKEGKYVCEIQLNRLEKNEKIRGHQNNFRTIDYVKEANQILSNQQMPEEFNQTVIELITRRRDFSDGPGSRISPTPYGRWLTFDQEEPIDLIEKMRGKCSVYPDQPRCAKMAYKADLFNLLNDLNNLKIEGDKLDVDQKKAIIDVVNDKGEIKPAALAKLLEIKLESISGFRIDKNGRPLLTEFKGYKKIKKVLAESELYKDHDLVDSIIDVLTREKVIERREEAIRKLSAKLTDDEIDALANLTQISGYHSLSEKAISEINKEMLITDQNQMQILSLAGKDKNKLESLKGKKNIFADSSAILSPIALRAQREAMKVVNRLREIYGEFDSIVVETTRAKNSEDEKARIADSQKFFEKEKKNAQKILENEKSCATVNGKLIQKLRLYNEQGGKTVYACIPIDLGLLISDPTAYEIDHIIPISISFDDSYSNKVLVTRWENQVKGNMTPMQAHKAGKFGDKCSIAEYRANVDSLRKSNGIRFEKKKSLLTYDLDINKFENQKEFIARNLIDTSYAERVVFNTLQNYFRANDITTVVNTVKGSVTNMFRRKIKLEKERDDITTGDAHHAIDALIIASLKIFPKFSKLLDKHPDSLIYDNETGEISSVIADDEFFDPRYIQLVKTLMSLEKSVVKFSYKIDTKPNRQIADETIYSTRKIDGIDKVVKKYKDIYAPKFVKLANDILQNNVDHYLMYRHSPDAFEYISSIVKHYATTFKDDEKVIKDGQFKKNPLYIYYDEHKTYLKKPSKNNSGPEIHSMKYFDGALGNCIDISKNYQVDPNKKKVVLQQISPYRTDFYYSATKGYRFVTIFYSNIRYSRLNGFFEINQAWYENEKKNKKIDDSFEFCFSMHHYELIKIKTDADEKIWKFTATNDDKRNVIEVKPIGYYAKEQIRKTIGKKIKLLEKYATDVCGNLYKLDKQELKLKFK